MNTATMAFRGITLASIMVLAVTTSWLLEAKRTQARSLTRSEVASIRGGQYLEDHCCIQHSNCDFDVAHDKCTSRIQTKSECLEETYNKPVEGNMDWCISGANGFVCKDAPGAWEPCVETFTCIWDEDIGRCVEGMDPVAEGTAPAWCKCEFFGPSEDDPPLP